LKNKYLLEELRKHASDTRKFFRNEMKPERERSVCRAFLRTIGLDFDDRELIAPTDEPADVAFRDARFQICEILDPNRKRGNEWKAKEKKYSEAESLDELIEPDSPPSPIDIQELLSKIVQALSEKSNRYSPLCKEKIDALVYINLKDRFLAPHSDLPSLHCLKSQGWRSVSFVFHSYGVILVAENNAPKFLISLELGRQYKEWQNIFSLFDVAG